MPHTADDSARDRRAELIVNAHRIPLSEGTDLPSLKSELLSAATGRGAFVQIDSVHGSSYEVLVTPATQIILVHLPAVFEAGASEGSWNTVIDLDI